jgi:D-alanyl-D-alanine carboxypeptidase
VPKGRKEIKINLHNTNPSLFKYDNILISKTGFTNPAGRCVLMLVEKQHQLYGIVILGQKNIQDRSKLATDLITADPLPSTPKVNVDPIEFPWTPNE